MGIFQIITGLSLALAGVSLVLIAGVIAYRAVKARQTRAVQSRRKELMTLGLECVENPESFPRLKSELRPGDQKILVRLFAELLPKVRGEYAGQVVAFMRELGLRDQCLARLRSRLAWQRAEACSLLGAFNDPTAIAALERMLDDDDVDVRIEAARSLAKLNATRSVADLLDKLALGTETRSLAAQDIFRSLNRDAVPELIEVLDGSSREAVKLMAVDALSHIGDLRAVPAMLKLMRVPVQLTAPAGMTSHAAKSAEESGGFRKSVLDANKLKRRAFTPEPERRRRTRNISTNLQLAVVQALSRLDDPRALPGIIAALDDPTTEVRAQAAICAGNLGSEDAVTALERALKDENWWVRYHAAEALYKLGVKGLDALWLATQSPVARTSDIARGLLLEKGTAA